MAEKNNENAQDGAPEKKGPMKIVLLGVLVLALLVGVAAGAYKLGAKSSAKEAAGKAAAQKADASATGGEGGAQGEGKGAFSAEVLGPMVNIDPFIVNILDNQSTRYLKAALTLELNNKVAAAEVKERMPQIRDAILLLVGNKTFEELSDLQGKMQLRAELISRLNGILTQGKVERIFFTDFVVQ